MSAALDAEGEKAVIRPVWLIWLDVQGDPLYAHTGTGEITFGASETGDPALDGHTFKGLGIFAHMGEIEESENGSGPVAITLPGVDPAQAAFKQIVADGRLWQFRRAVLWFSYAAEDGSGLIDDPEREKTGRMDGLRVEHTGDTCTITLNIDGFASSSGPPLVSTYSDQPEYDPSDISQTYVGSLSNKEPEIGPGAAAAAEAAPGRTIAQSSGGRGARRLPF